MWLNNAQTLIEEGKATISTAICTRDDIMIYLINKGVESEESFTIMERVRKGTVAKGKCKEWSQFKKICWSMTCRNGISGPVSGSNTCSRKSPSFRSLCHDGIPDCLLQNQLSACLLCGILRNPCICILLRTDGTGKRKLLYHMKEYKRRAELNQLSKKRSGYLKRYEKCTGNVCQRI